MVFFIVIIILVLLAFLISLYENSNFTVKKYEIFNEHFTDEKIRFLFISDLHDCKYGDDNFRLLASIDEIKPDFVIFGGDIFNGIRDKKNVNAGSFIKAVAEKYKSLYALGNHEFRYYLYPEEFPGCKEAFEKILAESGIRLLDNETEIITVKDKQIAISGLSVERRFYKRFKPDKMPEDYVSKILGARNNDAYNILAAHNPKYFKEYSNYGADLILSGHYHGGIMRLFKQGMVGPDFRILPKYSYGEFKNNKSTMIVSGGLGVHTLPFRIFNRPELVVIELKGKTNEY